MSNKTRAGWQTIAVLDIGVAANQGLGAAGVVGVAAFIVITDLAFGSTILFIDTVRMFLGSSLVVVVVVAMTVAVVSTGVVMIMSVVVVVVNMGMLMAVIVRSSAMVVSCGGWTTAGRGVLLWVARTAVGAHFGAGGRWCKHDVVGCLFNFFVLFWRAGEESLKEEWMEKGTKERMKPTAGPGSNNKMTMWWRPFACVCLLAAGCHDWQLPAVSGRRTAHPKAA